MSKFRKKLSYKKDRKIFKNTANRVHSEVVRIGSRGGIRI